jgi:hypothetical protein
VGVYGDAPTWLAEVYDPWPRPELARAGDGAGEVDLGALGERADGIRARRHPAVLLLEAPEYLVETWQAFARTTERDLRPKDALERLNAPAADAWCLMLGASRRRATSKEASGGEG